jgi:TPR repeat protein
MARNLLLRGMIAVLRCAGLLCAMSCSLHAQLNAPPAEPSANAAGQIDLNGVWEGMSAEVGDSGPSRPLKMFFYQIRSAIQVYNLEGYPYVRPGTEILVTSVALPAMLPATVPLDFKWSNGKGRMSWYRGSLTVVDADHMRINEKYEYHRTSSLQVPEIPCEEGNPAHVSGEDAYYRGEAYFLLKDTATATCWLRIGAMEGNGNAQSEYAHSLLFARGVAKDVKQGKFWAEKSANQHNAYGEMNLIAADTMATGWEIVSAMLQNDEMSKRFALHNPEVPFFGDWTAPPPTTVPVFDKEKTFTYLFAGEWKVSYPPEAPRHPVFTVTVIQKNQDFQLIVDDANIYYPFGESMFNGHYANGHITGDLMDAPAHSGNGYRGFAWSKAEIQIADIKTLLLPGNVKLSRWRGPMVANRPCDPVKDGHVDPAAAFVYAKTDYALKNYGTAGCWLYVSASEGNAEAAYALGFYYHYGVALKKTDDEQAFAWFRRAADADIVDAERVMAHCYELGIGTKKNHELEEIWSKRVKERVELARREAAEKQKEDAEAEKLAAQTGFLYNMLGLNPLSHAQKVQHLAESGMSASAAENLVGNQEADEAFWSSMIKNLTGYQPPPMPPK